jgi:hypothetical protein
MGHSGNKEARYSISKRLSPKFIDDIEDLMVRSPRDISLDNKKMRCAGRQWRTNSGSNCPCGRLVIKRILVLRLLQRTLQSLCSTHEWTSRPTSEARQRLQTGTSAADRSLHAEWIHTCWTVSREQVGGRR